MVEVAQRRQTELDDAVTAPAEKVGHEADAARVVLEPRVVESFSLSVETHHSPRKWYTDIIGPGEATRAPTRQVESGRSTAFGTPLARSYTGSDRADNAVGASVRSRSL